MERRSTSPFFRLTLAQQFLLASLFVQLSGMLAVGWWVGNQIEARVVERAAANTALYVDTFIDPPLQELGRGSEITPEHLYLLSRLVDDTPLGNHIVAFKVWDTAGRVVYDTNPEGIGQIYPIDGKLARALQGEVVSGVTDLQDEENVLQRQRWDRLLETYSPVNLVGSSQIIAAVEFYQTVEGLGEDTRKAQFASWAMVATVTIVTYLVLAGIVRRGSITIKRQQEDLKDKVDKLTALLAQNEELHERVRRATSRAASLNERYLHRISAELHDGPAQEIGLALLRLDGVIERSAPCIAFNNPEHPCNYDLNNIQESLRRALQEVRTISAGLRIPELDTLTLEEALMRVVRVHERRTETKVDLSIDSLPSNIALPVKITLFRVVQEALSNAYRHAGGLGQRVRAWTESEEVRVEVSDNGPGFDRGKVPSGDEHLGLVGMRERVESIGGLFMVDAVVGRGTRVIARLAPNPVGSQVNE